MDLISNEIFRAAGYLFISVLVLFAYNTASNNVVDGNYKRILWKGLLWCAGIALFTSITLGNPSCEERSDPVYGGCDYYADDGYEPTDEERIANFAYYMTLFYIPVVVGALSKKT